LILSQIFDGDVGMCASAVFDELPEDTFVVVADYEDLTDLGDFGDSGEAVAYDGMAWEMLL
jgi:hypothetical protein